MPTYNPNRNPLTRWESLKSWIEDNTPYIIVIFLIIAVVAFFYFIVPRCPKCDHDIMPMDTYCSKCGYQLRTLTDTL